MNQVHKIEIVILYFSGTTQFFNAHYVHCACVVT